jgi:2-methylcitrate dehydratase PrpD
VARRTYAKHLMLDALGIAFASTQYDFARRWLSALSGMGSGESDVIGMPARLPLRDAVMMNGVLAHGLDYDDTYLPGGLHATASCFPCALAMAAHLGASGRELLSAYIVGMEAAARLSAVAKGLLHQVGFHPTGLVASFGCALTAGRLLGLDAVRLTMAQGIALSTASSSSRQYNQEGAWTKRMHAGGAGVAGITAAFMAQQGIVGPRAVYEGRYGLFPSHLRDLVAQCDYSLATEKLGEVWEIERVAVKPFPVGQLSIACIDAAIAIARTHAIQADQVQSIRALVPREALAIVCEPAGIKRRPADAYATQFSLHYGIACSFIKGRFGLAELEQFADPEILALAAKVECEADPAAQYPRYYSGELIVTLRDGRRFTHREQANRGSADKPVSLDQIAGKFMDNAQRVMPADRAAQLRDLMLDIDRQTDSRALSRKLAS